MVECPYWVTKEVRAYFNVSRETIRRWIRDLGFPAPVHNEGQPRGPSRYVIAEVIAWDRKRRDFRAQPLLRALSEPEAHPDAGG